MKKIEVLISNLDHQGRGIARVDNKVIFIPFALPEDKLLIEVIKEKKNFCEGKILEYINKSNMHTKQNCPYFEVCGGCDLRHMDYNNQLKYKENKVKEILKKFSKIDGIKVNNILECENSDGYRNKIKLCVNRKLGLNKKQSHECINIDYCLLADSNINKIIHILNNYNLDNVNEVLIRSSYFTKDKMIVFSVKNGKKLDINLTEFEKMGINIIVQNGNNQEILTGKGNIIEKLNNISYIISPSSFFQINTRQTLKLYDLILKKCNLKGKEIVYDLYCGTGTIGIYLSNNCKKVIGIEINEEAVKDARANVKLNDIKNCEFYSGDVSDVISSQTEPADIIVVDPPRAGLDNVTIENMFRLNPKKIIYVSCDPVTLARDLNILSEKYNIDDVTPVDMFPNTYHVETVCVLERR